MLAVGGTLACTLLAARTPGYLGLLGLIGTLSLFVAPVVPLADHTVLALLEARHRYGKLRLWGAVGWGVAAPLTGWLVERGGVRWAFLLAAACLGLLWAVVYRLPAPAVERVSAAAGGVRQFVTSPWLTLLLVAFAGGVGLAVSGNFLYLHLADLGVRSSLVGLALTVATLSELPVFLLSGRLLRRYAAPTLLTAALFVFAARLLLYGVVSSPWLILAVQLLHGASFSLLWVAGVACADALAPDGLRATAQGLLNAALMGWGGVVGALLGGALYDAVGAAAMFRGVAAGVFAVGLGVVVWTHFRRRVAGEGGLARDA